ncbi:MAG TPA: UPF0182 family protein, partial [Bryobacteraceae bacterium]|nr:UPF0182 family protein [Bryobacteraceae bacterium]
ARGMKLAGTGLRTNPLYARASSLALLVIGLILGMATIDGWTIVRYYGAKSSGAVAGGDWRDPVFGHSLSYYFFDLPFYSQLLSFLVALAFATAVIYWLTARGWMIQQQTRDLRDGVTINIQDLKLGNGPEPLLLRSVIAVFLLGMAAKAYLDRYDFLYSDHGFMVGADYVNTNIGIPLQWMSVAAFVIAAMFALAGRWKWAVAPILLIVVRAVIPPIVSTAYVKPNELDLQRPYIKSHIEATRSAYGLNTRLKEVQHPGVSEAAIDPVRNQPLLDNVRLWDWRAFHDTVTQLQALRQYYVFSDTDVDRYMIDGKLQQVMVAPRELDIRQLPDARANWINGHFIYTHGYGLVMADATKITGNGQPVFLAKDAPPTLLTKSLQLTRPELYYGESTHEPVFVRTEQPEFNYPAGSDNVQTRYEGKGGIPIDGFGMRLAAALAYTDRNILLTGVLTPESRMMINRGVRERVSKLADFLQWDTDPYLVLSEDGRLIWMIDGYTASSRHPFSRRVRMGEMGVFNYIRNSVKATVDAYDGSVHLYVFDDTDPIIRAYQAIFPSLFRPGAELPQGLRAHVRYPETYFQAQTEIYRAFHMQVPEAFYNKEDLWDVAKNVYSQAQGSEGLAPTYVVATLPGETTPEFLLLQSFTPRSKDNLIGVMAARCDPEHYGEIVVLQLSKQSLIYGPLQIEARIDSDQVIAKDLSLWNQQGSQVLRGQMLVLPIDNTFLYVEPIYIQSSQARMPQLKKVVLAMGNRLIYRDTYDEALAELTGGAPRTAPAAAAPEAPATTTTSTTAAPAAATPPAPTAANLEQVRQILRRYRELSSQGRWSEAGRELEALEKLVGRYSSA